jgi:hypothetical protein
MKKLYALVALLFVGYLSGIAQVHSPMRALGEFKKKTKETSTAMMKSSAPVGVNHSASVVWSDDFSNPANWIFTHSGSSAADWYIGNTPPALTFIDEIASSSATTGYAIFDSYAYCDTANGQIADMTMASPADLTGHNYVRLKFSQYYLRAFDSTFVFVSNNNSTWTKFVVNKDVALGNYSSVSGAVNPAIQYIDISSVAANQDSVYVRFQFYSPTSLAPGSAGCGFAWMIDDLSIEDIPDVDASVSLAFAGEYTMIPVIQPEALSLRGKIINNGRNSFSGAKLFFDVYDFNTFFLLYSDSSQASGTIAAGDTSTYLTSTTPYLPQLQTDYFIVQKVVVPNDSDMTNDSTFAFFTVGDSLYARDYLYFSNSSYAGSYGFDGAPVSFGSMFHVYHASQFTSARIYLNDAVLNDHVSVTVYDVVGGIPNSIVGTTGSYTLTAADTGGAFITLPFAPWVNVGVGDYFVCINQLDTNRLGVGFTDFVFTNQKNFFNIDNTNWRTFESGGIFATPYLRVANPSGTLLSAKDKEVNASVFEVFPNPSNGTVYFTNNTGVNDKNITIKVMNNLGAIVKTASYDFVSHGRLDLSSLPAGVYTLNISNEKGQENKTIVLQ